MDGDEQRRKTHLLEIEAKFKVESHEPIRVRLRELEAERLGAVRETNQILDRSDGFLLNQGCGLRIRTTQDHERSETRCTLTYKGPRRPGPLKTREEIEAEVNDAESIGRILQALDFREVLWYQKRRETWRLDECLVALDEPARLGLFVEIEGPNEAAIRAVQAKLRLETADLVQESYIGLVAAYCDEHGIADRRLTLSQPRD